jgi:peptidoglycan-associated lipoprotein
MVETVTFVSPVGGLFLSINFWSLDMKNLLISLSLACMLAACGTNVPLNTVPVSDAAPKPVAGASLPANTGPVSGTAVAPVNVVDASSSDKAVLAARVVYFDYDSFVIKPEFQALIAGHARYIKSKPDRKVAIEGHTDETGGREYNLALGQKRADAVRSALGLLGVAQSQMEAVSFGKEKPAVAGSTDEAYAKNRRTEIRYP